LHAGRGATSKQQNSIANFTEQLAATESGAIVDT
jgi:hypothetical protein